MPRITISRPADCVRAVSAILGFEPSESLVALGVSRGAFTARIDHPHSNDDLLAAAAEFGGAYRRNPGMEVVLISFTDHAQDALDTITAVTAMLDDVAHVLHAFRIDGSDVYDVSTGRLVDQITDDMRAAFVTRAITEGLPATHPSREAKAEALFTPQPQVDPETITASVEALAATVDDAHGSQDEVLWMIETVRVHALTGLRATDEDAARLIVGAGRPTLTAAAIAQIDRSNAAGHAALWTDLTNRAPAEHLTAPALAAAFAYWQAGDGAAAWMAYDKAQAPADHTFAAVLHAALSGAINPAQWPGEVLAEALRRQYHSDA